jgi:hypothetical protein
MLLQHMWKIRMNLKRRKLKTLQESMAALQIGNGKLHTDATLQSVRRQFNTRRPYKLHEQKMCNVYYNIEMLLQGMWRKFYNRRLYELRIHNAEQKLETLLHNVWLKFNTTTDYELQIRNAKQNIETLPQSMLRSPNKISTNLKRRQLTILSN